MRNNKCKCGFRADSPMMLYDRWFCAVCDIWLELPCRCAPEECEFKAAGPMPEKPSMSPDRRTWNGTDYWSDNE